MRALERALEWLRPLVGTESWDYCVVWKLGDDPTRFIEWMGCCCGGAENNRQERAEEQQIFPSCRDMVFLHSISTEACKSLANLPCSMPLNSGIHGEALTFSQPMWVSLKDTSNSKPSHKTVLRTRVLIPVVGGLVELFTAKHIPKDKQLIEFVMAQCNISWEQEAMIVQNYTDKRVLNDYMFEGSIHSVEPRSSGSKEPKCNNNLKKLEMDFVSNCRNLQRRPKGERSKSKNLISERNRRKRIKCNLFALRALVPKITKLDRVSILGDAIEFIEELQKTLKNLEDELIEMEGVDNNENNEQLEIPSLNGVSEQVEVKQITRKEFLVKFVCEQKRGGFGKLMEAMDSLGLQVIDANVTTFRGKVLNILQVNANNEKVQLHQVRRLVLKIISDPLKW